MAMLEPTKPKHPSVMIFILSLAAAILVGIFLAYPKFKSWEAARAALADAQNKSASLTSEINTAQTSINELENDSSYSEMLDQALPNSADIPDLYAYLETMAKSSNLVIGSMQASDESAKAKTGAPGEAGAIGAAGTGAGGETATAPATTVAGGSNVQGAAAGPALPASIGLVQITMDVKGNLTNLNQFLHGLGFSRRLIDVKSIDVSADQENKTMDYKLVMNTYYEKGE